MTPAEREAVTRVAAALTEHADDEDCGGPHGTPRRGACTMCREAQALCALLVAPVTEPASVAELREAAATHLAAQRGEADEESAAREAVVEAAMRAYRADAARGGFAAAVLDAACERLDAICAKKGAGRS